MDLDIKVSCFENARNIAVKEERSIKDLLAAISTGEWKRQVEEVRRGNKEMKKFLPMLAFQGVFDGFRKKDSFIESSGIIILDIDNVEYDLEEMKSDIMSTSEHVLAAMISPSGNGLKVLYLIESDLIHPGSYLQIGREIVSDFEDCGTVDFLSITDCLIATYDPNIRINEDAVADSVLVKDIVFESDKTLEPLDETRALYTDPEDFFETVLANNIAEKVNSNYHYIQVATFDLARFGFKHPAEDLSFVIHYSEANFGMSPKNQERFQQMADLVREDPQLEWPYKLFDDADKDDDYVDYSDYIESKDGGDEDDSNDSGLIEYDNLLARVWDKIKEGDRVGLEISLKNVAAILRFKGTGIFTVTGIPGHGKTEACDQIILDLARLYGEETMIVGYEQEPEEHLIKLARKLIGKNIACPTWHNDPINRGNVSIAIEWLQSKFKHFDTAKVGGNVNVILDKVAAEIKRSRDNGGNPRYLLLDPFNMLSIKGKFSGHEKIEEILRRLTHFSHQMKIMIILVAHPFKMKKNDKTGEYEIPDFYSVKGSSSFFEMSYHGLTIYRTNNFDTNTLWRVLKVKQNNLGMAGSDAYLDYNRDSGRYIPLDEEGNEYPGDHLDYDWLEKAIAMTPEDYEKANQYYRQF